MTALVLATATASAQPTAIRLSGVAFVDYAYTVSEDDPDLNGANSFDYRRVYLTADSDVSDDIRVRVRLEAQGSATTASGNPAPFVKDAWVRWRYAPGGHRATLGVQPPPLFQTSEAVWGYRSLERVLIDRFQSSRDLGLRLDGPLALDGDLRYAAMVGNGRGIRPEPDGEEGKHVYGQLAYSTGALRATLGADYVARVPVDAEPEGQPEPRRETGVVASAFVGAVTERYRVGVEGFFNHTEEELDTVQAQDGFGVSVFGVVNTTAQTSVIARYDYSDDDASQAGVDAHLVIAAVAYRPAPALSLMPNVLALFREDDGASVVARFTAAVQF